MGAQRTGTRGWWRSLRRGSGRGQLLVTVIVALLLGGATYTANAAAGCWQDATAEEITWSAAAMEQIRFVYLDEATDAALIARWENRATVLGELAAAGGNGLLAAEAETARQTAEQKVFGLRGANALVAERFRLPGGGFDVVRRLAELRHQEADPAEDSVPALMAEGDRLRFIALALALACVPLVLIWVVFQAVAYTRRRSRRAGSRPPEAADVGLVPHPWTAPPPKRRLTAAALAAWILVTLIPAWSLYVSCAGQRSDAEAARTAVTISTYIQASNLYSSQDLLQRRIIIDLTQSGLSRQLAGIGLKDAAQDELGAAEVRAADSWSAIGAEMTRLPSTADGIDAGLIRAMSATPETWSDALEIQVAAAEVSDRAGSATNLFTLAATLAALAMSLITLALAKPDAPAILTAAAIVLLAGALLTAFAGAVTFL
jgi:hypothetical protein